MDGCMAPAHCRAMRGEPHTLIGRARGPRRLRTHAVMPGLAGCTHRRESAPLPCRCRPVSWRAAAPRRCASGVACVASDVVRPSVGRWAEL